MKLFIKKQIGSTPYTFTVEGTNLYDCVLNSQRLGFSDVHNCGICQSSNLQLNASLAKGMYKYTNIKCLDCQSTLTFGSKKEDPNHFYLRKNKDYELDWKEFELTV